MSIKYMAILFSKYLFTVGFDKKKSEIHIK